MKKINYRMALPSSFIGGQTQKRTKKIILNMNYFKVLFLLSYALAFGQVGIGTDKPDPNTALDVNGKVKVRDLPKTKSNGEQIIVTDSDGNLKTSDLATELLTAMKPFGPNSSILEVEFKSDLTKASGKLHTDAYLLRPLMGCTL